MRPMPLELNPGTRKTDGSSQTGSGINISGVVALAQ